MIENKECHGGCCCHEDEHNHGDQCCCQHNNDDKLKWLRLIIAVVLFCAGITAMVLGAQMLITLFIFAAAYIIAGYNVMLGAVRGLMSGDWFGEEFLMTIASVGAFTIGEYAEACAVILLFELGEGLQHSAVEKSRGSIRAMLEMRPERITVEREGKSQNIEPSDVRVGDILLIMPGEKIACDGVITEGSGEMDMSALTGESLPVFKQTGDEVLAGSISLDATFRIQVIEEYDKSTVAKILEMLEHARANKSHTETFIRRFSKIYTPAVCAFALLVVVVPPLFGLGDLGTWLYRGLCALAASCPCALVISVPLGFFSGLGAVSREGVLIKGGNYLEALAKVDAAAFDKTGTLTSGRFVYCGDENAVDVEQLHRAVAICEKYSTHPIAEAVNTTFDALIEGLDITEATAIPGKGVRAVVGKDIYLAGNAALLYDEGIEFPEAKNTGTHVYAAENGVFLGSVTFADEIKSDSEEALRNLAALGITDMMMLTGDKREIADKVAECVGISKVYAELLPAEKAEQFAVEKANGKRMLYVGDGINDAPVLALADVGIAMGGIGSAAALEAADMVVMGDSLSKVPDAVRIARRTMRIVRQNIVFSLAVKLVIVLLSAIGITGLWVAVFGDVGVCLLAVLNALRVMKKAV